MKIKKYLHKFYMAIYKGVKRFPVTIGVTTLITILLIVMAEISERISDMSILEPWWKVVYTLVMLVPITIGLKLYSERKKWPWNWSRLLTYGGAVVLVALYVIFIGVDTAWEAARFVGLNIVLYCIAVIVDYLPKRDNHQQYLVHLFVKGNITALMSFVLCAGVFAILATIDGLLDIRIYRNLYLYIGITVGLVFAPMVFLSQVPLQGEALKVHSYSKLFKTLLLYIIVPLVAIYSGILYIYFIKAIATNNWPDGRVSHLVLWYSALSVAVLIALNPFKGEIKWVKGFITIFPKVMLPLMVCLLWSISIRINAYGITENRYMVVALSTWVLLCMIYLSFIKNTTSVVIVSLLAVITFISFVGPANVFTLSWKSQQKQLVEILERNNALKGGKVDALDVRFTQEDQGRIMSIIGYLDGRDQLDKVEVLPENFKYDQMKDVFGFSYGQWDNGKKRASYFLTEKGVVPIEDYSYHVTEKGLRGHMTKPNTLYYDLNNKTIELYGPNEELLYSRSLNDILYDFYTKFEDNKGLEDFFSIEEMTYKDENDKVKVKFVFDRINGQIINNKKAVYSYGDFDFYYTIKP